MINIGYYLSFTNFSTFRLQETLPDDASINSDGNFINSTPKITSKVDNCIDMKQSEREDEGPRSETCYYHLSNNKSLDVDRLNGNKIPGPSTSLQFNHQRGKGDGEIHGTCRPSKDRRHSTELAFHPSAYEFDPEFIPPSMVPKVKERREKVEVRREKVEVRREKVEVR